MIQRTGKLDFDTPPERATKRDVVPLGPGVTGVAFERGGGYVTLWRHVPSYADKGIAWETGTKVTAKYPAQDTLGLLSKATMRGWFAWPPGADPDLARYPKDKRKDVLNALEFFTRKEQERKAKLTTPPEAAPPATSPPLATPAPPTVLCAECGYEPPLVTRSGGQHPEYLRRSWLTNHTKKQHATQASVTGLDGRPSPEPPIKEKSDGVPING